MRDQHILVRNYEADRRKVPYRIERGFFVQARRDRNVAAAEQDRIAVGRRLGDRLRPDIAAGAGAVLDHDGLPKHFGHAAANRARDYVTGTARRECGNEADWLY